MKKIVLVGEFESSKVKLRGTGKKNLRKSVLSRLIKKLKSSK
jgi:hypothetical protein